jgi:hypothetical protein
VECGIDNPADEVINREKSCLKHNITSSHASLLLFGDSIYPVTVVMAYGHSGLAPNGIDHRFGH